MPKDEHPKVQELFNHPDVTDAIRQSPELKALIRQQVQDMLGNLEPGSRNDIFRRERIIREKDEIN